MLIFYLFFGLLYQGAGINFEFDEHLQIMKKNKQLLNDLIFFKEFYFEEHIQNALVFDKKQKISDENLENNKHSEN
jgi:hypothetical protein